MDLIIYFLSLRVVAPTSGIHAILKLVFLLLLFIITILSVSRFGASALPSTTFLLVRYGVCLSQIIAQPFTDDACQ